MLFLEMSPSSAVQLVQHYLEFFFLSRSKKQSI